MYDLSLLNTFFRPKRHGISHTFSGRGGKGQKCIDYILTRHRDRSLVRNVVVAPQVMSDHHAVIASVQLGRRGHRVSAQRCDAKKQHLDWGALPTDHELKERVAHALGKSLTDELARPVDDHDVDGREALLAETIMQVAMSELPPRQASQHGRGWSEGNPMGAVVQEALAKRRETWRELRADPQNPDLKAAMKRSKKEERRARERAVECFLESHVAKLEEEIRRRDQRGFFERLKGLHLERVEEIRSQCIKDDDDEGTLLRTPSSIRARWARHTSNLLNSKSPSLDPDVVRDIPACRAKERLALPPTLGEVSAALSSMANRKAVGPDGVPSDMLKLGTLEHGSPLLYEFTCY